MPNAELKTGDPRLSTEVTSATHPTSSPELTQGNDKLPIALPDAITLLKSVEVSSDILRLYRTVTDVQWEEFLQRETEDVDTIQHAVQLRDELERAYTEYRQTKSVEDKSAAFLTTLDIALKLFLAMNLSPE